MIDILFGLVIILGVAVGLLFLYISELRKIVIEVDKEQHVQNKDIYDLMKKDYEIRDMITQHAEIITYLVDQDPLLGNKKVKYPVIVGEA